jgi:hypothetical protein
MVKTRGFATAFPDIPESIAASRSSYPATPRHCGGRAPPGIIRTARCQMFQKSEIDAELHARLKAAGLNPLDI